MIAAEMVTNLLCSEHAALKAISLRLGKRQAQSACPATLYTVPAAAGQQPCNAASGIAPSSLLALGTASGTVLL
jgi:hypothetical protein